MISVACPDRARRKVFPMDRTEISSPLSHRRSWVVGVAAGVALLIGLATACTSAVPQAVLNVPGNYVADLWSPPPGYMNGAPGASVLLCLDEPSAVLIQTGDGGQGWIGSIDLEWSGTKYHADNSGSSVTMTTPVLGVGCGSLYFAVDCCHVDNYLAVKVTKV